MTGYISSPLRSVSLFLLPFLRSTAYSDVVVTVVAEVQWIPNIVLVSGRRVILFRTGSCVSVRCSSAVIPPPLPFRCVTLRGFLPSPRAPAAASLSSLAPRTGASPRLTRHPTQMECSPATFLTPQPPHCHGLPSAFPARLQARPHLRANIPLELGLSLTRPALPALPCPGVHQGGLPLAPQTQPYPHAHPYLPQIRPSLSHVPGTASPPRHASVEALLQWPADLSARSPRAPRRPFPPAVHADAPTKHPGACLPAPCSPPRPLLEIALPGSLIHVGRPPAMAPSTFLRYSPPCTLTPTAPAGGLEETSFGDGKHTSGHRGSFPTGTGLCAIAPECAALAARIAASGRLNCYPCLPGAVVRLPEPTQDQNPLGVASGIRESQPARDLARTGQAAHRGGCCRPPQPTPYPQPYPQPYRRPPYPSPPPHHHPQQENQHKPRSITANTRGSSRSPSGGREGGGGWAASGASWWKRREVATAAKTFAPRDGGGGLNRAWAGRHPQNTARAAGFSHTRQKPRASGLAPCSHLSVPRTPLPGGRWNSAKGQLAALAGNRTRVNCLEGSYAHHYTTNAPQPGRPPHAGPGSPQHTLAAAASASLPRRPAAGGSAPPPPRPQQPRGAPSAPALRRRRDPPAPPPQGGAPPPCGPPALRSPPRPANASALTPAGNAGHAASSTQLAKALLHRALGEATSHDDKGHGTHLPARVAAP
ncbi:PREDICTED: nascent polypeptide-associated complex subunit alpha, muscle-specific form-like [Capra hircus]|uniref:nascent polypeptide-associated complex subunit alpha, muscle-specific form-like n=1 Tax=Capra hircus TaxID=9925 RepID=UPI0008472D8E|nr:PREDICTED: nascent polypeptide-associated complex subunit alpha, muscle-specific form-like [Capra hircus]